MKRGTSRTNFEMDALDEKISRESAWTATGGLNAAASAAMVNRTHRVVKERAKSIQARRSTVRSLSIPLAVSGGMLAVIVYSIWSILGQDELVPTGLPDANQQMLVLMMWFVPVTVLLIAVVLFHRSKAARDNGRAG